jgi:cell division protein FtsN
MLRAFVLFLLLLNGIYFAWGQGWLLAYGFGPAQQHEPHRLAQQIKPEAIELISEQDANKVQTPVPQPNAVCLQSTLLEPAKVAALRNVLEASLPAQAWVLEEVALPARWIIYMGKYANAAELAKKRAQLANLHLTFEPLSNPALAPGLSLGAFGSQVQADAALEALALRGVRTARVLQELPASQAYRLRLPAVDDALQKQLPPVRAALAGQALLPCNGNGTGQ